MLKHYTIDALIQKEEREKLWDVQFLGYPLWVHCRDLLSSQTIHISSRQYRPTLREMIQSTYQSLRFLYRQKRYKKVYFLADRMELLEIYRQDPETDKILFVHHEKPERELDIEYISADFFNMIRFALRKTAYMLFPFRYRAYQKCFSMVALKGQIRVAMGDALFLKLLSFLLDKSVSTFYAVSVIPPGEKFLNRLHSYEIQHGVIHAEHVGYIGIPKVHNTLIVYHKRYMQLLRDYGYKGELMLNTYKDAFLQRETDRQFVSVIYTQPLEKMQKSIELFFEEYRPTHIWIQRHPKDTYAYRIEEKYFVQDTLPSEVEYPICYTSTVIENFLMAGKPCLIYDVGQNGINIESILSVYREGDSGELRYFQSLKEISVYIEKSRE